MKNCKKKYYPIKICVWVSLTLLLITKMRVRAYAYLNPTKSYELNDFLYEEYEVNELFTNVHMNENDASTNEKTYELDLCNAHSVILGIITGETPCCYSHYGQTKFASQLIVNGNNTYTGETYCEIKDNGVGWGLGKVTVIQNLSTSKKCDECGKIGYFQVMNTRVTVERNVPRIVSNPESQTGEAGNNIRISCAARFAKTYRWQVENNGVYIDIDEGAVINGITYTGTNTDTLIINSNDGDKSAKYRCAVYGVGSSVRYTQMATVTFTPRVVATPTVAPTPIPTVNPTPVPTMPPIITPIVTPYPSIIPDKPKDERPDIPSQSSSSYKFPIDNPPQSSSSTSSTSNIAVKPSSTTMGNIDVDDKRDSTSTQKPKSTSNGKPSAGKSSSSNKKNNFISASNSSTSRISSSVSTVMKDGILYVLDDEDIELNGDPYEESENSVEVSGYDIENSYSESDLMSAEELLTVDKTKKIGLIGWLGIIAACFALTILMIFILFFGVIIEGECEEHDDVFDLYGIRMVYRKDGRWTVDLGEVFEENAVVRLRLGILFVIVFKELRLDGIVNGATKGIVSGEISQKMFLYRKRIRRITDEK